MPNKLPPISSIKQLYVKPIPMERTYMKVSFHEYLKETGTSLDALPTVINMVKSSIPYLARHVKWWEKVDPEQVRPGKHK